MEIYWIHFVHLFSYFTAWRNVCFILCFVSSTNLVIHPHNTSKHKLGVVSGQGVVQWRYVLVVEPNLMAGFHIAREGDYIAIPLNQLPGDGHGLSSIVLYTACNIRLLSVTTQIAQSWYLWFCGDGSILLAYYKWGFIVGTKFREYYPWDKFILVYTSFM